MQVNVVGYVWAGYRSSYTYTHKGEAVPTLQEVNRLAGDFADVEDFEVRQITRHSEEIPNGFRNITEVVTVRPWTSKKNARFFLRSQA